jgi:hypothetical protein
LFDQSITVTNPLPTAGGEDVETDDLLRNRARNFWNTARRGVLAAITQGALNVAGVVSATSIEALNVLGQPARLVELYIADSTGVANAQLTQLVQTSLNDYRGAGIYVAIFGSIPVMVPISLNLVFQAGVDTVAVGALVVAGIVGYVNTLPVNGVLSVNALGTVLQRFGASGLDTVNSSVLSPVGNLVPAIGTTLRTQPGLVTF